MTSKHVMFKRTSATGTSTHPRWVIKHPTIPCSVTFTSIRTRDGLFLVECNYRVATVDGLEPRSFKTRAYDARSDAWLAAIERWEEEWGLQ